MRFTKCNLVLKNCSECFLCISEFTHETGRLPGVVVNKHGEQGLHEWLCQSHTYRGFCSMQGCGAGSSGVSRSTLNDLKAVVPWGQCHTESGWLSQDEKKRCKIWESPTSSYDPQSGRKCFKLRVPAVLSEITHTSPGRTIFSSAFWQSII